MSPPPQAGARTPESFFRRVRAARRQGPVVIDGRIDEPAWLAAELGDRFTQLEPDEGAPPAAPTRFRVLWDDASLYVAIECDDPEPLTATLSRRDRPVEGDWVSFDLDTTNDRRTAYHFQVFAGGHQLDGLHFNDTDFTADWDAAWESAVARTPSGWSVEMRIPLRILRIPYGATDFGFNVYRYLARRKEQDQWRYRPRGASGDISLLGQLTGLAGIHPDRALELRPYVATRTTVTHPAPAPATVPLNAGLCTSWGMNHNGVAAGCAGLDLRYSLASDLLLVGTINPDFGQVEADQRVLNVSTFETFFPEKRPFFTEGLDLFQSPLRISFGGPYGGDAYQVFYSRRIGKPPPDWDDTVTGTRLYQPSAQPVGAAMKLSGTIGSAAVGLLTAYEQRLTAQALQAGKVTEVRTSEAAQSEAFRVRMPLGSHALLGMFGTARDPVFTDSSLDLVRRHAHVGGADFTTFDAQRDWSFTAQAAGSLLSGGDSEVQDDGTILRAGSSGAAVSGKVAKDAGPLIGFVSADWLTPQFTTNDLGFMRRANLYRTFGYLQLRDVHANSWYQRALIGTWIREVRDSTLALTLAQEVGAETFVQLNSQWNFNAFGYATTPSVDDRELGDGTPIERQAQRGGGAGFNSDSRKPVSAGAYVDYSRGVPRFERLYDFGGYVTLRPVSQLETTLGVDFVRGDGVIRQIRTAGAQPSDDPAMGELDRGTATQHDRFYLLAPQFTRSVSWIVRATYAFSPHLTLQLYAQLFGAGIAYGDTLRADVPAGKHTVRFSDLGPAVGNEPTPDKLDERQAGLNVNLILRWEWRLGSTLYLVYAHETTADFTPTTRGLDFGGELGGFASSAAKHGDTFLVKVDVLKAL
ncbi:MAG TPA: DUF5916 domain-containing protein [Myxococcales bacterium]|nr:DUF5916 domain-containing protein [Myxococcales bacterium]